MRQEPARTASDVSNSNVADYKSALHTSRGQPHAMICAAPRYMEGWAVPNRVGLPQIFLVIPTRPDGYWKDGAFTRFTKVDLKAIEQAFAQAGTRLSSIRENSSLTMLWYKFSHRITPDSASGSVTHSTTKKASSS